MNLGKIVAESLITRANLDNGVLRNHVVDVGRLLAIVVLEDGLAVATRHVHRTDLVARGTVLETPFPECERRVVQLHCGD